MPACRISNKNASISSYRSSKSSTYSLVNWSYRFPSYELPYEGAKEMLLVDEVDNKEFLTGLFHTMYDELPAPKSKKKK